MGIRLKFIHGGRGQSWKKIVTIYYTANVENLFFAKFTSIF